MKKILVVDTENAMDVLRLLSFSLDCFSDIRDEYISDTMNYGFINLRLLKYYEKYSDRYVFHMTDRTFEISYKTASRMLRDHNTRNLIPISRSVVVSRYYISYVMGNFVYMYQEKEPLMTTRHYRQQLVNMLKV